MHHDGAKPPTRPEPGAHNIISDTSAGFAVRMAVFYGALFLIYGVHLPFFPVWLEQRGLTTAQISLIIAAPLFLRILVAPAIAAYADARRNHRQSAQALAALALLAAIMLSQQTQLWPIAIGSLILALGFSSIMPLAETITMTGVRAAQLDYGRMRLWGSATFILASFIGGAFVESFGAGISIWLICAAVAATLAASTLIPKIKTAPARTQSSSQPLKPQLSSRPNGSTTRDQNSLAHNRLFILFLICAGLSQASHATYYAFATLKWLSQGISPLSVGALWALGVAAEIALFSFSRALLKKTGAVALLIIGALAGVIRWTAMAFDPPLSALIPLQLLHALTYGATHIGAIHFIAHNVPVERTATAQAFYGTIGNGIALGVGVLVSGWLIATYGSKTYFVMAATSLIATVAGIAIARIQNGPTPQASNQR